MLSPNHAAANGLSSEEDPNRLSSSARSTSWSHRPTRRALYRKKKGSISSERSESPTEKMASCSSEESIQAPETAEATPETPDPESAKKAREKLKHIVAEIVQTEQDYVVALDMCINGYMKAMQSDDLPSELANKERLIFGNIQAVHDFHSSHFLVSLQLAGHDVEAVGKCFLDHSPSFEVYITYCENKPKSESFIWTYLHTGGTFFQDIQKRLKQRQGIDSFLIKPVQRISQYQLLLRDLQKSAVKSGLASTPHLNAALQQMQDIPKRANDAMTLSMICGYDGAISASGQLIMHDEFTVYERSRWTGASRHLFLMDQRLIFTKEKDADGLYVYKDSLKVHSLSIVEKQDDSPSKFAVGTGPINSWDQYYVLEASSPEKKQVWVEAIKKILQQQFQLLKALKQPAPTSARHRSQTLGPATFMNSVAHINVSDDSEDEGAEEGDTLTPFSPLWAPAHPHRRQTTAGLPMLTVGENTVNTSTLKSRPLNLYVVAEDCAPSKDDEGILFIRKGQVYDITSKSSDWWFARLARDTKPDGAALGKQGWVPSSFLEKFTKSLSPDEEAAYWIACHHSESNSTTNNTSSSSSKKSTTFPANNLPSSSGTVSYRKQRQKSPKSGRKRQKITSSFMENVGYGGDEPEQQLQRPTPPAVAGEDKKPSTSGKAPQVVTHLTDETVIVSRTVRFRCKIARSHPEPSVEWSHDGKPLTHDRAFTSLGDENCLLRLQNVAQEDEGLYTCTICNKNGCCTSTARLTVIGPPSVPGKPVVKPVTSTSVRISWTPPTHSGHSPINLYLIECKDTLSGRWSTLMQRITDTNTVMDDLMPGTEYVFRVLAGNQIGSSPPSPESDPVLTARSLVGTEFSLEPFHDHYQLVNIIARGQFSEIWECLHCSTQQSYVAKLIPLSSGNHAHHELKMLTRLSHTNTVCVSATYQTDKNYIFLFQLLRGLNLFEYVTISEELSEPLAAYYMEQLMSALEYLHNLNVVHLAIKPENVMVVKPATELPVVKLLHFSRAREVGGGASSVVQPHLDHMEFEAPELLKGEPVTVATDMWSLGVLLYTLLGGVSPFLVDSLDLTKDNICSGRYSFPGKHFKTVSERGRDIIAGLLVGDQSGRLSASQCLQHTWTRQLRRPDDTSSSSTAAVPIDLSHLKSYVSTRKWQTSAFTISSAEH
ncbi:Kalirin [Geodia barretti]|nr:Kalirin [Geodia barretti]